MVDIKLSSILHISEPRDFKLHAAIRGGNNEPLDHFVAGQEAWDGWNRYKPSVNAFNRRYIFSMCRFYHEKEDVWLFGGIYEVLGIKGNEDKKRNEYDIKLTDQGQEFIGRLKLVLKKARNARVNFEKYYDSIVVSEILKERYAGYTFTGFEAINLNFERLSFICTRERADWKAALRSIKGVYLITDQSNGKKYVGSAYGDEGIWSRWNSYTQSGHGGNKELKQIVKKKGIAYARKNFSFSLLEYHPARINDEIIIERENFWKTVLLSRGDYGYNRN